MKYIYLVYEYQPKYKYGYTITEGHYKHIPKCFNNYKDAKTYMKKYKHTSYIRKIKLR